MEQWARDPHREMQERGWSMVKEAPSEGFVDISGVQGIWKKVLEPAPEDSPQPRQGSFCQINYEYFFQGKSFDKTDDGPLEIIPGSGMTSSGMEQGLISMRVGERARFVFDPLFAFRENGFPPHVPPHAVVELEMTLVEFMGPWTEEEKIGAAGDFKAQGNELFKKEQYRPAMKKYARGLDIVGRRRRRLHPQDAEWEAGQAGVRIQLLQNTMQCWHKLGIADRALDFAKQIIHMNPANPKARFRLARNELDHFNYDEARAQLAELQDVKDADVQKAVSQELRKIGQLEARAREKERLAAQTMAKMFGKSGTDRDPAGDVAQPEAGSPTRHVNPEDVQVTA